MNFFLVQLESLRRSSRSRSRAQILTGQLRRKFPSLEGHLLILPTLATQEQVLICSPQNELDTTQLRDLLEDMATPFQLTQLEARPSFAQTGVERHLESGKAFCHLGLADDALPQLKRALELDPACSEAYHYLAALLKRQNQSKQALKLVRQGLRDHQSDPSYRYLMADLCLDCDRDDEAIVHLKEVIRLNPLASAPYARLGEVFHRSGQTDSARLAFEEALAKDNQCTQAYSGLGSLLLEEGRLHEAFTHLEKALQGDPSQLDVRLKFGWCLLHLGRPRQAEVEFLKVANDPTSELQVPAKFSLGRLYHQEGPVELARDYLTDVCKQTPALCEAQELLAQTLMQLDCDEEALRCWKKAASLQPDRQFEFSPQMALCLSRMGQHDEALALVEETLEIVGPDTSLLELLASFHIAQDHWENALCILKQGEQLDPESAFIAFQLGWVHENLAQLKLAESYYNRALRLDPQLAEAYSGLGWLHYEREQLEVALLLFEKALEFDPDNAEMADQMGWVHLIRQQYAEALQCFEQAIAVDPDCAFFLSHRAAALFHLGQLTQAKLEIQRILADKEGDSFIAAFSHYILGLILQEQGLAEEAERLPKPDLELVPPEFLALTSGPRAKDSGCWQSFRNHKEGDSPRTAKRSRTG